MVPSDVRISLAIAHSNFECRSWSKLIEPLSFRRLPLNFFDNSLGHHIVCAKLSFLLDNAFEESFGFLFDKCDTRQINYQVSAVILPGDRAPRALYFSYPGAGKPTLQDEGDRIPTMSNGDPENRKSPF